MSSLARGVDAVHMQNVGSADAETALCQAAAAGGSWMLNLAQQQVLVALTRWFGYSDGGCPFERHEKAHSPAGRPGQAASCAKTGMPSQIMRNPLERGGACRSPQAHDSSSSVLPKEGAPAQSFGDTPPRRSGSAFGSATRSGPEDDDVGDDLFSGIQEAMDHLGEEASQAVAAQEGGTPALQRFSSIPGPLHSPTTLQHDPFDPAVPIVGTDHCLAAMRAASVANQMDTQLQNCRGVALAPDAKPSQRRRCAPTRPVEDSAAPMPGGSSPHATAALAAAAALMPTYSTPFLLVRGVLGAGKTTMLAACLAALCR